MAVIAIADNYDEPKGSPRGQGGLTPSEENRLVRMMMNPRRRWKVTAKAKEKALKITEANLSSQDERVSNGAVANLLKMEAQNQSDQHIVLPKLSLNVNVSTAAEMTDDELLRIATDHAPASGNGITEKKKGKKRSH
jgi:hypothetical protein